MPCHNNTKDFEEIFDKMNVILRKSLQISNAIKTSYSTNIWRAASIQPPRQPVRWNVFVVIRKWKKYQKKKKSIEKFTRKNLKKKHEHTIDIIQKTIWSCSILNILHYTLFNF